MFSLKNMAVDHVSENQQYSKFSISLRLLQAFRGQGKKIQDFKDQSHASITYLLLTEFSRSVLEVT